MRVLFDTNVVLDLLLDREPFADAAASLFARVESGDITGFIGATTVTTIHYLASQAHGPNRSRRHLEKLLDLFDVAAIDETVLRSALSSKLNDYEDAVLHAAALSIHAECIVTRNVKDFRKSVLRIYSPDELLVSFSE